MQEKSWQKVESMGFFITLLWQLLALFIIPGVLILTGYGKLLQIPAYLLCLLSTPLILYSCSFTYLNYFKWNFSFKELLQSLGLNSFPVKFFVLAPVLIVLINALSVPLTLGMNYLSETLGIAANYSILEQVFKNGVLADKVMLLIAVTVIVPLTEELMFRKFIFSFLHRKLSTAGAVVITAGYFALVHNDFVHLPALFLLGIVFQMAYLHYRSLWAAIYLHSCNNILAAILLFSLKLG